MKLIVANWKNHPGTHDNAIALARQEDVVGLIIAPPEKFLSDVARVLERATLGAQDWSDAIKSCGVEYVIIGHSERRAKGETDAQIAEKMKLTIEQGMIPILCVGESAVDHAAGRAKEIVEKQLRENLSTFHVPRSTLQDVCIAYEPIWAISTNPNAKPDTPDNAANMIQFIKREVNKLFHVPRLPAGKAGSTFHVLYGGSVDERNAESFLSKKEIDGCLVGGASLRPEAIKKIVNIATRI